MKRGLQMGCRGRGADVRGERKRGEGADAALADHHLLREEDLLRGDFHPEVAARHHDAVRRLEDAVKVLQSLLVLDLGDDLDVPPTRAELRADHLDVRGLISSRGGEGVAIARE